MREKIQAMTILLSFSAVAAAHLAVLPALVAFEVTGDSTIGFWAYVVSLPVLVLPVAVFCVWLASYALDRLGYEGGEWVTVKTETGQTKKVRITPKVHKRGGGRDLEKEQYLSEHL